LNPLTHWIWYDFEKREPVISRTYPSGHKIPEAFQRQLAAKQSPASSSQGVGISLSSPSFGGAPIQDEGFTHGAALPDDFKLWLSRHPGLAFDEARSRYRKEQKTKQRRTGPKQY
jgi:mobilization protein